MRRAKRPEYVPSVSSARVPSNVSLPAVPRQPAATTCCSQVLVLGQKVGRQYGRASDGPRAFTAERRPCLRTRGIEAGVSPVPDQHLAAAGRGCGLSERRGGDVGGTLALETDGTYSGRFARRTRLLFCGAHGPAAAGCSLTLEGKGAVAMTGVVLADEMSPSGRSVRVTWTPAPGHDAEVTGACAESFKQAVREMYLSTPHAAEFPLTTVGSAPRTEELDSYAWKVRLD